MRECTRTSSNAYYTVVVDTVDRCWPSRELNCAGALRWGAGEFLIDWPRLHQSLTTMMIRQFYALIGRGEQPTIESLDVETAEKGQIKHQGTSQCKRWVRGDAEYPLFSKPWHSTLLSPHCPRLISIRNLKSASLVSRCSFITMKQNGAPPWSSRSRRRLPAARSTEAVWRNLQALLLKLQSWHGTVDNMAVQSFSPGARFMR